MEAQSLIHTRWTKGSVRRDLNKRNGEWVHRDVRAVERAIVELVEPDGDPLSDPTSYEELVRITLARIPVHRRAEFLGLLNSLTPSQRQAKLKRALNERLSGAEKTALCQAEKALAQKREHFDAMRAALAPWTEGPGAVNCLTDSEGNMNEGPASSVADRQTARAIDYWRRAHKPSNAAGAKTWERGLQAFHEDGQFDEAYLLFERLRVVDPSSYVIATLQMALCRDVQGRLDETYALETDAFNKAILPEQRSRAASNLTDTCLKLYKLKGGDFLKKALAYSAEAIAVPHPIRLYNRIWALARAHQKWPDRGYLEEARGTLRFAFSLGDDVRADLVRLFFRLQEDVLVALWLHISENQLELGAHAL